MSSIALIHDKSACCQYFVNVKRVGGNLRWHPNAFICQCSFLNSSSIAKGIKALVSLKS